MSASTSTNTASAFNPPSWVLPLFSPAPQAPRQAPRQARAAPASRTKSAALRRAQPPPPDALHQLIVQWLTHMRDDPDLRRVRSRKRTRVAASPLSLLSPLSPLLRLGAWLALLVHAQLTTRRALPSSPPSPSSPSSPSSVAATATETKISDVPVQSSGNRVARASCSRTVSPLFQSLYFAEGMRGRSAAAKVAATAAAKVTAAVEDAAGCVEVAVRGADERAEEMYNMCVMPFFLTESGGMEGRGILERLKEVHGGEAQRAPGPLAWVPAALSFALMALNPLRWV
ncbi:unnamed protein product [Agarophyton chilense]